MRFLGAILGVGLTLSVAHAELSGTESYGVFIQSADGYVAAERLESFRWLNFDATARMMTFPAVERDNENLELIVHHPDFRPGAFELEARPVTEAAAHHPQPFSVTPLGDDRFRITVREPVSDGNVVLVALGCCIDGVHGVMLGDAAQAVKSAFAEGADLNPASAEHTLERIVRAVPGDEELEALHAHWQLRLAQREATRHFEFIEEIWANYENAEDVDTRIDTLRHVRSLTESYLEDHPNGLERDQVQRMKNQATQRLDI